MTVEIIDAKDIIEVLKQYIDESSIKEILLNCYNTILEHKFKIIAHFYFLIEKYISFDKILFLKNTVKDFLVLVSIGSYSKLKVLLKAN